MKAIFESRHSAESAVHDPPGLRTFESRKSLNGVKHAVRSSVHDLLESGDLTDAQSEAVKEAAADLRSDLQAARRAIVPGDISTAQSAFEITDAAIQDFFADLDAILGEEADASEGGTTVEPVEPVDLAEDAVVSGDEIAAGTTVEEAEPVDGDIAVAAVEPGDSAQDAAEVADEGIEVSTVAESVADVVASDDDVEVQPVAADDSESVDPVDGDSGAEQLSVLDSLKQAISSAMDGFLESLQNAGDRQGNPYAGFYAAVELVSDPVALESGSTSSSNVTV
jgi:hypothetical protein